MEDGMSPVESMEETRQAFHRGREALLREFQEARKAGVPVRLGKKTSNLFRIRNRPAAARILQVAGMNRVLAVNPEANEAEVGGMTTYETLVASTLLSARMPAVVPELKTITVGGAVTGGGIESSSFRYGFVHETVTEIEVLTANGELVVCTPTNEHRDLFYGFANSYGTLGYALRLKVRLVPVKPFVKLTHRRHRSAEVFFDELGERCLQERTREDGAAFIDGTVFSPDEMVQTTGEWAETAHSTSDYTFMRQYYRSIRERESDTLKTGDYIWRWDTDWFWCSRAFGMEYRAIRFPAGLLGLLNSKTYWKLRSWNERSGLLRKLGFMKSVEWVIQDVEIPVQHAAEFQDFLHERIGIRPVWICPVMAFRNQAVFPLYTTDPDTLYINYGFWGGVPSRKEAGYYNRLVEDKVSALAGKKSLYSTSFFTEEEFWTHYNEPAYRSLKRRYDPENYFPDLYEKCVGGI